MQQQQQKTSSPRKYSIIWLGEIKLNKPITDLVAVTYFNSADCKTFTNQESQLNQ